MTKSWAPPFSQESTFKDTGCHLHPKCLECPRAICIHDEPEHSRRPQSETMGRVAIARAMRAKGKTYREIAAALGYKDPSGASKLLSKYGL